MGEVGHNDKQSILFSLEFLKREAEINGYKDLGLILQTAIALATRLKE